MFRKILIGVLFAGLMGVLIWGGVNRTIARAADSQFERSVENSLTNNGQAFRAEENYASGGGWWLKGQNPASGEAGQIGIGRPVIADEEYKEESNLYGNRRPNRSQNGSTYAQNTDGSRNPQASWQGNGGANGQQGGSNGQQGGGYGQQGGGYGQPGMGNGGSGKEPLAESEIQALEMALDDEYHALATYISVMNTFGEVEPFYNIAQSEQRHIDALVNQFEKYGVPVPENPWLGEIGAFDSLSQACQTGVEAEIANAELYTTLLEMTAKADLLRVFTNLSRASMESHLPEFEACR